MVAGPRPKTWTSPCPVWVSSTSPFRVPVRFHWAANWTCERLAMMTVIRMANGIVIRATPASSGEIQIIMPSTPTMVSTEVSSWLRPCCSVVVRLSMSLLTRLRMSPCGWLSKYRSGSRVSFCSIWARRPYMVRWVTPARR